MRILVVTPYLPWPLSSGGNAAQFATLRCLADDHQFVVICALQSEKQHADLKNLSRALPKVRFVGVEAWEKDAGRFANNPAFQAVRKLYRDAREIFLRQNEAEPLPAYPFSPLPADLVQAVGQELKNGVDICQVEFAELMSLGPWLPAALPKVFVHHQIHFIYARRFIEARGDAGGYGRFLEAIIRAQEIAFLKHFNTIVTFSNEDRQFLKPLLDGMEVVASPFPLPADIEIARETPEQFSGAFCYVASEPHMPNRDALAWLHREIWPKISTALPSAKLNIVGDWSDKARKEFSGRNIHFTGFVPKLASVVAGGIQLVPLKVGSGIRVKILAAMALGAPVVTTRIGGEGIAATNGVEMMIRDTADDFAAAAVELARQPALWSKLSAAGRAFVVKNYSPESVRDRRNQIYNQLVSSQSASNPAGKVAAAVS